MVTPWNDRVWDRVDDAVRAFEAAWDADSDADLASFLPPHEDPDRRTILTTLIEVDQEHRWSSSRRRLLEEYLQTWPELENDAPAVVQLLASECRNRVCQGVLPSPEELRERFPKFHAEINLKAIARQMACDAPTYAGTVQGSLLESVTSQRSHSDVENSPLSLGTMLGRYRILTILGRGGMGTVYLAKDDDLDRTVAIKVLHHWVQSTTAQEARLLEEARSAARLKHPSIVPVYDVGTREDGSHFLVMQHVEGRSLAELVAKNSLDTHYAIDLTIQIADALHDAHRQGLVHRDVKPANVIVDDQGQAHITDFGLAIDRSTHPRPGELSGTLPYMAPEQLRGDSSSMDGRTDIWALGAVLYEMTTGQRPFRGKTSKEIKRAIIEEAPRLPRRIDAKIPRVLERVCLKCLAKDPSDRYVSAADLADDLRACQTRVRRKGLIRWLLICALVMVVIVGGMIFTSLSRIPNRSGLAETPAPDLGELPISPWLADCKLVLTAFTGAMVDLEKAEWFMKTSPCAPFAAGSLIVDPSRQAEFQVTHIDDWLCWEMPLKFVPDQSSNNSMLISHECSLSLRLAVNQNGYFQLGTLGDVAEDHLLVFALPEGGLPNYFDFANVVLPSENVDQPRDAITDTDERQTLLARWFCEIYAAFAVGGVATAGPSQTAELHACRIRLRSFFDRPVTVVTGCLFHQQFDFEWQNETTRRLCERKNSLWSPIAEQPTQEADLRSTFDLECSHGDPSILYLCTRSDGDIPEGYGDFNASSFKAYGLTLDDPPAFQTTGSRSSISFDTEEGSCEGRN